MAEFPELTIGEVARRAGVATSSIRYYERVGLLPRPLRLSGQRRYDAHVLERLRLIAVAQGAGFKLREIRDLLNGIDGREDMGEAMRTLSSRKLGEIESLLARANAMKQWLELASGCDCPTPAECALFSARGDESAGDELPLAVIEVEGRACRRLHA